jgi:hypothetical protein
VALSASVVPMEQNAQEIAVAVAVVTLRKTIPEIKFIY